jgi:AcrR family transcriptional regulator
MKAPAQHRAPSARREELLDRSYEYVLHHGLSGLSLRPLAAAVGSSPRVLLFLFGSKDGLVRALLARARADEISGLGELRGDAAAGSGSLADIVTLVWAWLVERRHRSLLRLWADAYAQSLIDPDGPWTAFGRGTVEDWLALLAEAQPCSLRSTDDGIAERTLALAVMRGALLDLLATGDEARTTAAVERYAGTIA